MISHKKIHRFHLEGEIYDESVIYRIKERYIAILENSMRSKGYVRRYDIDYDFTISYNGKTFDFILSVYGVYVGRKQAACLSGIDKNKPIKNTIHQNKLNGSFSPAV